MHGEEAHKYASRRYWGPLIAKESFVEKLVAG